MIRVKQFADSRLTQAKSLHQCHFGDSLISHGCIQRQLCGYDGRHGDHLLTFLSRTRVGYIPWLVYVPCQSYGYGVFSHLQRLHPVVSAGQGAWNVGKTHKETAFFLWRKYAWIDVPHSQNSSLAMFKSFNMEAITPRNTPQTGSS